MKKQEFKIESINGDKKSEVYFFQHSLKTAREHADAYIERNKGKLEMKLFRVNEANFGDRWIFIKKVNK